MMLLIGTPTINKTADNPCKAGYHHRIYRESAHRVTFDVLLDSHNVSFIAIRKVYATFECCVASPPLLLLVFDRGLSIDLIDNRIRLPLRSKSGL